VNEEVAVRNYAIIDHGNVEKDAKDVFKIVLAMIPFFGILCELVKDSRDFAHDCSFFWRLLLYTNLFLKKRQGFLVSDSDNQKERQHKRRLDNSLTKTG